MSSATVYSEIKDFLVAAFSGTYQILDFDEIDTALEQGDAPFLVLEETAGDETLISFGDRSSLGHREQGVIGILIFAENPAGSNTARNIAESVRDALRLQTIGGVVIQSVAPPEHERLGRGLWAVASSAISYRWDMTRAAP